MGFNKYARYYLSGLLTKEIKRELLSFFYRSQKIKTKDLTNYIEVKINSHMQKSYTKDENLKKLLKEIQDLKIGTIDYELNLSSECIKYLNTCYKDKYFIDIHKDIIANTIDGPEYDKYLNDRIKDIENYCLSHFIDTAFNDDGTFKVEYLTEVFNKGSVYDYDKRIVETISYAIAENKEDMLVLDSYGNITLSDIAYEKYVVNYEQLPLTTKEKIRKSMNNTYRTFIDYARCNLSLFKYFVTLTFAPKEKQENHKISNIHRHIGEKDIMFKYVDDLTSIDECSKILNVFFTKLKNKLKRRNYNLYYLGVPEFQKNGAIHYHFLMSDLPDDLLYKVPSWLDKDYLNGYKSKDGIGLSSWTYGKSDVELIEDKSKITTYISKYMIKSFNDISDTVYLERLNKQRYYKSNNLIKPKELTEDEYELIREEVENNYISVYTSENKNVYTDNVVVKKLYQLNDI